MTTGTKEAYLERMALEVEKLLSEQDQARRYYHSGFLCGYIRADSALPEGLRALPPNEAFALVPSEGPPGIEDKANYNEFLSGFIDGVWTRHGRSGEVE